MANRVKWGTGVVLLCSVLLGVGGGCSPASPTTAPTSPTTSLKKEPEKKTPANIPKDDRGP
jgi:hypothetical protein